MIAEDHSHGAAFLLPDVGPVELGEAGRVSEGAVEHSAIGRGPGEAQLGGDGEGFVGDRAFRWPQPARSSELRREDSRAPYRAGAGRPRDNGSGGGSGTPGCDTAAISESQSSGRIGW